MNIIVAGGAGFLGLNLIKRLLDANHNVICIDNFFTGVPSNLDIFNGNDKFSFIEHNIVEDLSVFDLPKIDVIFNFASIASPFYYVKYPIDTLLANSVGIMNLLKIAERDGATFIQASTSEVYGDANVYPQKEDYFGNVNPVGPRSSYDEGKRFAESFCYNYRDKVDVKIARIFNVYGPFLRKDDYRVIPNFIVSALKGDDLVVYGDGTQTRSFCYVDDFIDGILALMHSYKGFMGPVNIGNPDEISINQLAETVIRLTNSSSRIVYSDLPQDDPKRRCPDISLAKKELNFSPSVSLEEGLLKTIEYFKSL